MLRKLAVGLLLRRLLGELHAIAEVLDRQTALIERLVAHFAPAPVVDRDSVRVDTGVTHLDENEQLLALTYIDRTKRDTGHTPDDEEILIYLADEKTTDLHKRLSERDDELQRLMESRR